MRRGGAPASRESHRFLGAARALPACHRIIQGDQGMPAITNPHQILRWTALAVLLATTCALAATPAAARDKHHKHWNYEYAYDDDEDEDDDDDGGYYGYYEPPRVIYRERRYYDYEPAPTHYYPPPPPVFYYPQPRREPSLSFGVTLPIN
jgi:hypothetical protein